MPIRSTAFLVARAVTAIVDEFIGIGLSVILRIHRSVGKLIMVSKRLLIHFGFAYS
jgi:hypothetical protein